MSLVVFYHARNDRVTSSLQISYDSSDSYVIVTKRSGSPASESKYKSLEEVHNHLSVFTHVLAVDRARYTPYIDVVSDVMPMVRIHARLNRKLLHNIVNVVLGQVQKQRQEGLFDR